MNRRTFLGLGLAAGAGCVVKPETNRAISMEGVRCIHLSPSEYLRLPEPTKAHIDGWLEGHGFDRDHCSGMSMCDNGEVSVYMYDRTYHVEVEHTLTVNPSSLPINFDDQWSGGAS